MNTTLDQATVVEILKARQQGTPPTGKSLLVTTGFCLVVLAIGLVFFLTSWNSLREGIESRGWAQTTGEIVSSEVRENTGTDNDSSTYSADVEYTYRVHGKEYTASNVKFGAASSSNDNDAYDVVNTYPSGTSVTVYYAPDNPSHAVLRPGIASGAFIGLGIGGFISLIGIGLLLWMVVYNVKHFVLAAPTKA